jgi:hypothetical protein
MKGLKNTLCAVAAMACNEPVGALPHNGKFESWHAKICFAERLRLQISFFDSPFPFWPHNVFRVLTQRKQHLSFGRMHMSKVWPQMIDALSTDGKGKDYLGDAEFELHPQASLLDYVYLI